MPAYGRILTVDALSTINVLASDDTDSVIEELREYLYAENEPSCGDIVSDGDGLSVGIDDRFAIRWEDDGLLSLFRRADVNPSRDTVRAVAREFVSPSNADVNSLVWSDTPTDDVLNGVPCLPDDLADVVEAWLSGSPAPKFTVYLVVTEHDLTGDVPFVMATGSLEEAREAMVFEIEDTAHAAWDEDDESANEDAFGARLASAIAYARAAAPLEEQSGCAVMFGEYVHTMTLVRLTAAQFREANANA